MLKSSIINILTDVFDFAKNVLAIAFTSICGSATLMILWGTMNHPLDAPSLILFHAFGLITIYTFFTIELEQERPSQYDQILNCIVICATSLGFGAIAYALM